MTVVCFWLLALARPADAGSFDADVDLRAWRTDGVPVAVALSLLTVPARTLSVSAVVVLTAIGPPGTVAGPLLLVAPAGALLLAWPATRLLVRPLHLFFPDERDDPDEPVATSRAQWDRAA
ncbi:hypothetical protein [Streptomyces shenzhenensis]|uniref:hypothetical protein n=1 Tax=Streptomyces shenzhenensis TaxID=943815 RepID=UPI0015EFF146|nr:hypothetical protein [Streptomyces shenzhenensis]